MKTSFILICLFLTSFNLFAGYSYSEKAPKLIFGKIIDKKNGEEIAGAVISIGDKTIYSDLNGSFSIYVEATNTIATVTSVSYEQVKIVLDPISYNSTIIELQGK